MAGRARALAFEHGPPAIDHAGAGSTAAALAGGDRPQVGDDLLGLRGGKVARGHRRAGNAFADDLHEILIRFRSAEYAAAQIDARDLVAVRPVAVRAGIPEHPSAVLDI